MIRETADRVLSPNNKGGKERKGKKGGFLFKRSSFWNSLVGGGMESPFSCSSGLL